MLLENEFGPSSACSLTSATIQSSASMREVVLPEPAPVLTTNGCGAFAVICVDCAVGVGIRAPSRDWRRCPVQPGITLGACITPVRLNKDVRLAAASDSVNSDTLNAA